MLQGDKPYKERNCNVPVYVIVEAQSLTDIEAPPATNIAYQIHTKCLIKHQKIIKKQ